METPAETRRMRFGAFDVDLRSGELHKHGVRLKLQDQPFKVLALLLERSGDVVTREELRQRLWPADTFVDFDTGLNSAIKKLRDVLGDSASSHRYIETLPRRGYRFVASTDKSPAASPRATQTRLADGIQTDDREIQQGEVNESRSNGTSLSSASHLASASLSPGTGEPFPTTTFARTSRRQARAGLGLALTLVALALAVLVSLATRRTSHDSPAPIKSLAVLPLKNLSADPTQEFFADGVTEALITELGKISGPRVISRQSVMQYKDSKKSLAEIARELNVDAVLEGAVGYSGERVKVTIHLAQALPERQLWAHEYDRNSRDVLSLQDEIARTVVEEIQVQLTAQDRAQLSRTRPVNPEAYADYLRGRSVLTGAAGSLSKLANKNQYNEQDIQTAIAYFKSAIDKDPAYAQAFAGLADAHIHLGHPNWGGHPPKETLSDAKEAATTALKLDPSLPEAHFSLAQTLQYDWNWPEAEKEYKLALKLNPSYVDAYLEYGRFVQAMGRNDEALVHMRYADELDPLNIGVKEIKAWVTYASRQYDFALQQFEILGDEGGLIHAYREKRMYPEAIALNKRWTATHPSQPRDPYCLAIMASVYGLQGRNDEAEELIKQLKEAARQRYVSGFFFAEAYVGLGQNDEAINWLERAYEAHDQWMVFANSYPGLDRLRSEPRFQALMRRMNFPL